jgi:archaellin
MKIFIPSIIVFAIVASILPTRSNAQTIAKWTFETSIPNTSGPYSPETGSGSASGSHSGASIYTSPAGDGSPHSFSATNWAVGDLWQLSSSTAGYNGIQLEWDQISSATGPKNFDLTYSTDGTTYLPVLSYSVLANSSPNAWSATTYSAASHFSVDLSTFTDLNNAPTVFFRLADNSTTSANGGTTAVAGTDRMDNFTIEVVPEPASAALVGLGCAALFAFRRRS